MKNWQSLIRCILISITILFSIESANSQTKRIYIEVSPLYSYLKYDGYYSFNPKGKDTPQLGISCNVKFEIDINKYISLNSGISYESRRNEYVGTIYDTSIITEDVPYRYNSLTTYEFIGVPITLKLNYFTYPKLVIYQTLGIKGAFLMTEKYEDEYFYETGEINYESGNVYYANSGIIFSLSSSIGIRRRITDNLSFEIEPGFNFMLNNVTESDRVKEKFIDLKLNIGISYDL